MRGTIGLSSRRNAQTLVFFAVVCLSILLLCGLAIDSGVLYLAKARMSRAVDGAALAAVGNFHRSDTAIANRDLVATIMRNFAVANFTDLSSISTTGASTGGTQASTTNSAGQTTYTYTYNFNDGKKDANGQYKRFVQVVLTTGTGGSITSATCNARCPVHTYFIGFAGDYFKDLKVSSSAVATRNPRLIMVVLDRSASMLDVGGGAFGLPPAIVQFLDFFDTSSDNIGIVSFGSSARLEMPLTTNFLYAGTNNLIDAYQTNAGGYGDPGIDPEQISTNLNYDQYYYSTGVRRLKFGGQTAADEGIRLGMEQLMANSGFYDPDVLKYMVIFTDGKWNQARTLLAAPGYSNIVSCPYPGPGVGFVTNATAFSAAMTNGQYPGPWLATTNMADNANLVPVPTLSPLPYVTNAIQAQYAASFDFSDLVGNHLNDTWMSVDGAGNEPPIGSSTPQTKMEGGTVTSFSTNTWVSYDNSTGTATNYYTQDLDVWLQPGSVDYVYSTNVVTQAYVSDYTNPTKHIYVKLNYGESNMLVVPGYVADGLFYDGLDLTYRWSADYPCYRYNNYQEAYMWPDDATSPATSVYTYLSTSLMRQLLFRNYANLLTGFYIFRPDEPTANYDLSHPVGSQGVEPLITEYPNGYPRPLYGNGPYYPSAGFYWPFGDIELPATNVNSGTVGLDPYKTYGLRDATVDVAAGAHHIAYSINMLSTNAAPNWSGELFYKGSGGVNSTSGFGTTSISSNMTSASDWKVGAPTWITDQFDATGEGIMTSDATHNTNINPNPAVWRPLTFNGSNGPGSSFTFDLASITSYIKPNDSGNFTHGYVSDGNGNYYRNTMAWSGRPTHYFDFSQGKWIPIADNHTKSIQAQPLNYWKSWEYCWHARALGVTIYTVGYGTLVAPDQQVFLAQIANATNTTAGNVQTWDPVAGKITSYTPGPGTAITYNPTQPIGQQFFGTNSTDISNDFFQVGQAINAALTQ